MLGMSALKQGTGRALDAVGGGIGGVKVAYEIRELGRLPTIREKEAPKDKEEQRRFCKRELRRERSASIL